RRVGRRPIHTGRTAVELRTDGCPGERQGRGGTMSAARPSPLLPVPRWRGKICRQHWRTTRRRPSGEAAAIAEGTRSKMQAVLAFVAVVCLVIQSGALRAAELPDARAAIMLSGVEVRALVEQDFARFDPHYSEHRQEMGHRLDGLGRQLAEIQATGNEMECSNEIYLEAKWLYHYTA